MARAISTWPVEPDVITLLQLEAEKKEVETEKHLKVMSEKEMVSEAATLESYSLANPPRQGLPTCCCTSVPHTEGAACRFNACIVLQSRISGDMQQLEKERLELEDRASNLQHQIFKGSEKLDQFKLLMNWNQEELEQWALAQKQKEEDNLALEKYR